MAASLERRDDGSIALYINGDLQFDSLDERIYHEALALPALALAAKRLASKLRVLVIGGGDGLVAREMFKSTQVATLDLVDYDPTILAFARKELAAVNEGSMSDSRITTYVQDAWDFVDQAVEKGFSYDVIVSDLTVAETAAEARFHSVDWYAKLARILSNKGVLAVNGVSPQATPQAYWSIFNGILKSTLHPLPYHINLPSFSASGYGFDWGFFIASGQMITADELASDLSLAGPRHFLLDTNQLRQLFIFPEELFAFQPQSLPAVAGSDILLHYFNNSEGLETTSGLLRDAFSLDTNNLVRPEPDTGKQILPPELCSALSQSINASEQYEIAGPAAAQLFLHEVLDLMPSLQREQTSALITEFLEAPAKFLQAIDLPGLIDRLLRRASELPSQLVAELKLLKENIVEWADDQENLLNLGRRVVTVLILAIVVGNLLYPDSVYGKGAAGHAASGVHHSGGRSHGSVGRGGWNNGWGGGTTYYNNRRVVNPVKKGPIGPGPSQQMEKDMRRNSLPQKNNVSDNEYIDESGNIFPVRRYRTASNGADIKAVFRLGPGTDVLPNGHMAMPLTDNSFLLVTPTATHVIERQSDRSVISLQNDPRMLILTTAEIDRQHSQLSMMQTDAASETAVQYLSKTQQIFQEAAAEAASRPATPAVSAIEIFPSVSLTTDGQYLAVIRDNRQTVYMDGNKWYSEPGSAPLNEPYPKQFRSVVVSYLTKMVRETEATEKMLRTDRDEVVAHMNILTSELGNYETAGEKVVNFGTRKLPREEAIRLTQLAVRKAEQQIKTLDKHIQQLPGNIDTARIALANLSERGNA